MILSRRLLVRLLAGAGWAKWNLAQKAPASPAFNTDRLLGEYAFETTTEQYRVYRADAVISLFSVRIFSRSGVGSGYAEFRQARRNGSTITTLRFGGGSVPQRARNLNRFGLIEEVVVEKAVGPVEAAYFGFMTSSPEQGMGEARKSLESSHDQIPYVAVEGDISKSRFRAVKARFSFSNQLTWSDRTSILHQVRSRFDAADPEVRELSLPGNSWPGTFLHLMAQAIRQHPAKFEGTYVYNAKHFHLTMEKAPDPKMAASFAARHLTTRPDAVVEFRGLIHDDLTAKLTRFRVWTEQDGASLLPLRIELEARSFLSLAFEYDPTLAGSNEPRNP